MAPGDVSAVSELRAAKAELDVASASPRYHARRSNAMDLTADAIRQLEQNGGNPDDLAQHAIQDVQFCIYMADHPNAE